MAQYQIEWRTNGGAKLSGCFSLPDDDAAMALIQDDTREPFANVEVWRGENRIFAWEERACLA
ncbi:MAG: hypothetical protein ABSA49_12185 [Rhizomicrobium sp.]|jgi:hypothetical protein